MGSEQAAPPPTNPTALVRVELSSEPQLADLADINRAAALEIPLYLRLDAADGRINLIVAADKRAQQTLSWSGYSLHILDPDTRGASYYLLSGAPEALRRLEALTQFLFVEGRQVVARADAVQLVALAELGIRLRLLSPGSLIVPQKAVNPPLIPASLTPDAIIQEMVSRVSSQTLYHYVGDLSGEWAVTINNAPYTIATRFSYSDAPIKKATRYAYEYFQSLGLPTDFHTYMLDGLEKRNVVAEQIGVTQPEKIYLLVAHLDSTSYINGDPFIFAPGADDNASGSAAVMQIANILSQYDFGCTLRYALVTGEEQGLNGSQAYAGEIYYAGEALQAVLNLDMLAYNSPGSSPTIWLHTRQYNYASDLAIANLFADAIAAYSIGLTPYIRRDGESGSDHASFWAYGYPAILAIEDWNDHTPYYHRTGDRLATLNLPYYTEFVKAALATFAHMGCLLEGQLVGTVRDSTSGVGIAGATVEAWQNGSLVRSTTAQPNGAYQLALQPGDYSITFSALDHRSATQPDVVISNSQTTSLDSALQYCCFVKGTDISLSTSFPEIGQSIHFTATVTGGETPISYAWDFGDSATASGTAVSHAYNAQGMYLVTLNTNNTCQAGQTAASYVFVDMNLIYLPIAMKNGMP